jgi:hypothetical protein
MRRRGDGDLRLPIVATLVLLGLLGLQGWTGGFVDVFVTTASATNPD